MAILKYRLFINTPISVLTCSGTPALAFQQKGSYGYLFDSNAASRRTSPAPYSEILVIYAG